MIFAILLGVLAIGMGLAIIYKNKRSQEVASYHITRCQECGQKLRYLAAKAGRDALCPRCGNRAALPDEATAAAEDRVDFSSLQVRVGERKRQNRKVSAA